MFLSLHGKTTDQVERIGMYTISQNTQAVSSMQIMFVCPISGFIACSLSTIYEKYEAA